MSTLRNSIFELIQIAIAIFLASVGLKAFLLPNGFLDGGVTGIAILISKVFSLELSLVLPIATLPFVVLGWFTVSQRLMIRSVLSVICLSLVIHFENFQPITEDKLIICIFGGAFLGAGIGLAIKSGAVLDGSEVFGIYLNEKLGISIGTTMLIFNLILFAITAWVISLEVALYSILAYVVTGKVIDLMIQGFENYVGLMIVSNDSVKLQQHLIREIGQGLTVYNGIEGYGSHGKQDALRAIHTVVNRIDAKRTHLAIEAVDKDAFVIEFDVNHVKGGVLRKYLSRKNKKALDPDLYLQTSRLQDTTTTEQ